jgi:hypothetical protein
MHLKTIYILLKSDYQLICPIQNSQTQLARSEILESYFSDFFKQI